VISTVRRWWYIAGLGFLITLSSIFGVTKVVPLKYRAQARFVILPSGVAAGPAGDNPYLSLQEGLDITVGVLSSAMTDDQTKYAVEQAGATGIYTMTLDKSLPGPILLVTATDLTPAATTKTLNIVGRELPIKLTQLQRSVGSPDKFLLSATQISVTNPHPLRKTQIRAVVAVLALGLAATYLALCWVEGRPYRRHRSVIGVVGSEDKLHDHALDRRIQSIAPVSLATANNGEPRNGTTVKVRHAPDSLSPAEREVPAMPPES
jgi:hypothetical protein